MIAAIAMILKKLNIASYARGVSRVALPIVVALVVMAIGCSSTARSVSSEDITTRIVITQEFGQNLMLDETITVPSGASAMEALREVAEVETKYGGGFVNAINGLRSEYNLGIQRDWLFNINGISSNKGAGNYILQDGDTQHWDFHDWGFRMFIPATVGGFPEPFIHGFGGQDRPTAVVYADGFESQAETIEDLLIDLGVQNVSIQQASHLSTDDKQSANVFLIGTVDDNGLISEMNGAWDRLGFFVHFEGTEMLVYDGEGELSAECGSGCGVIQATQNPWNPKGTGACENVAWMVSGTDEAGVNAAIEALLNQQSDIEHAFAVVVIDGKVIRVPQ